MLYITCLLTLFSVLITAQSNNQCGVLKLEWGTYQPTLSTDGKICIFSNVRFAGPPTGKFRFQKAPDPSSNDPAPPTGPVSCLQVNSSSPCIPDPSPFVGGGDANAECPIRRSIGTFSEDCLFLDLYVPLTVITGNTQVPVVVWIYGGAYLFGSKDQFDLSKLPLYSGQGVLQATTGSAIFVAGNYRLGAFGWLGGSYMKVNGVPNVGLYDQRKTFEFVQNYIHLVNGDKSKVSAWGESAGAGSIMHHLTAKNGQQDPLFSKATLQSPAWQWAWDQNGKVNETYTQFARYAKCPSGEMACLQSAPVDVLVNASQLLFQTETACNGIYPVGPTVDGGWVKTLPAVALKTGQFWKKMESLIVSHVATEVADNSGFVPAPIKDHPKDPQKFEDFLTNFMPQPDLESIKTDIDNRYNSGRFYGNQLRRAAILIRDSTFTCNTRQLFDAYRGQSNITTYMLSYGFLNIVGAAVHASDLVPTFVNQDTDVPALIANCDQNILKQFGAKLVGGYIHDTLAPEYQSKLISHAIYGDPNNISAPGSQKVQWKPARTHSVDMGNQLWDVLKVEDLPSGNPFSSGPDNINTADICGFWDDVAQEIMAAYPAVAEASSSSDNATSAGIGGASNSSVANVAQPVDVSRRQIK